MASPLPDTVLESTLPENRSPLIKLPDELLLKIASHLEHADLYELSLSSRQIRAIAQDVIFQSPSVLVDQKSFFQVQSKIARLAETIVQRPDLARKVQHLVLQPKDCRAYINSCFDRILGGMLPMHTPLRRRTIFREEVEVVDHILSSLSNLKSLRLDLFKKRNTPKVTCITPLPPIGCWMGVVSLALRSRLDGNSLSLITGLQNLRLLHLGGTYVPWD